METNYLNPELSPISEGGRIHLNFVTDPLGRGTPKGFL